jgi:nucleotide-binding universal stress UspA family protein
MYKHILVCTDGSEVGQRGVDHGLSLAKFLGAKVTIITVTERFPIYGTGLAGGYALSASFMTEYLAGQTESANAILSAAKQAADRLSLAVDTLHVPDAQPADAIIETAKARGCDLIAMASHGRRGLGRLVLGSVTSEVLAQSPVPVLVVR